MGHYPLDGSGSWWAGMDSKVFAEFLIRVQRKTAQHSGDISNKNSPLVLLIDQFILFVRFDVQADSVFHRNHEILFHFSPWFRPSRQQWPKHRSRSRKWAVSILGLLFVIAVFVVVIIFNFEQCLLSCIVKIDETVLIADFYLAVQNSSSFNSLI